MWNKQEKAQFLAQGYLHVPGLFSEEQVARLRIAFDAASIAGNRKRVWQETLLGIPEFLELLEYPPLMDRLRGIFGNQVQLLSYDLLYQGPHSASPAYGWHRDFVFPGDVPLAINSIVYLDAMTEERGPTVVVPGSHRGTGLPPTDRLAQPLPGEVKVYAKAGDVVFINAAIWHSGGRNQTDGARRAMYIYFGYWWLKRDNKHCEIPAFALENASEERLRLLGVKPVVSGDMWVYDPADGIVSR
jgi:hypothetical protein